MSNISVASDSGRVVGVLGDIMGYVFARKNILSPTFLGDTGVVACIAAAQCRREPSLQFDVASWCELVLLYVDLRFLVPSFA